MQARQKILFSLVLVNMALTFTLWNRQSKLLNQQMTIMLADATQIIEARLQARGISAADYDRIQAKLAYLEGRLMREWQNLGMVEEIRATRRYP